MNEHLIHDTSWSAAYSMVEVVAPCLREEEQAEAFHAFYRRVRAALEAYAIMSERGWRCANPSRN